MNNIFLSKKLSSVNASVFITGISAVFIAQVLKFFLYLLVKKEIKWKVLFIPGQMPSSHSSGMSAFVLSWFLVDGYISTSVVISFVMFILVIHDALNVRWYGGIAAQKIENLITKLVDNNVIIKDKVLRKKIKLVLGHKGSEVLVGIFLGLFVSFIMYIFIWPSAYSSFSFR